MKFLIFGDIVGKTGRRAVAQLLPQLTRELAPDLVIANGENVAHGVGISMKTAQQLYDAGVEFLTTGNHVFDKQDQVDQVFAAHTGKIIRPANFEGTYPGDGWAALKAAGQTVVIANFNSQVFMEHQFQGLIASPFTAFDRVLQEAPKSAILLVDFHSEATSEKRGFGFYLDGRATVVWGTHTHIQTADAQILPGGTAYISDVGMTGAADSILGVKKEAALTRFLQGNGAKLDVDEGNEAEVGYIIVEVDDKTRKARSITARLERIKLK